MDDWESWRDVFGWEHSSLLAGMSSYMILVPIPFHFKHIVSGPFFSTHTPLRLQNHLRVQRSCSVFTFGLKYFRVYLVIKIG
jgi:hypothetical protein